MYKLYVSVLQLLNNWCTIPYTVHASPFLKIFQLPSQYFHAFKVGRPDIVRHVHVHGVHTFKVEVLTVKRPSHR